MMASSYKPFIFGHFKMLISSSAALLLSGHYQHDEDVKLSQEEEEAFSQIIHTPNLVIYLQ